MYERGEVNNIIHAGLILMLYLFIVIILYFTLSYPIDLIFGALETSSVGTGAESYMAWQMPGIRWGLNVAFALGFAFPIVWFVTWVFGQEPDFSLFKR